MREQFRMVEAHLRDCGLDYRHECGGGHHPHRYVVPGLGLVLTMSWSPKDRHVAGVRSCKRIDRAIAAARIEAEQRSAA